MIVPIRLVVPKLIKMSSKKKENVDVDELIANENVELYKML